MNVVCHLFFHKPRTVFVKTNGVLLAIGDLSPFDAASMACRMKNVIEVREVCARCGEVLRSERLCLDRQAAQASPPQKAPAARLRGLTAPGIGTRCGATVWVTGPGGFKRACRTALLPGGDCPSRHRHIQDNSWYEGIGGGPAQRMCTRWERFSVDVTPFDRDEPEYLEGHRPCSGLVDADGRCDNERNHFAL